MAQDVSTAEYCCPGEAYPISRAVHLGRLASFYRACRDCPCRDDTVGLSARQIRQLAEVGPRAMQPPLFHAEGVGNAAINDLSPSVARGIAIAFARHISWGGLPTCLPGNVSGGLAARPTVVVASDGRMATAAILAAIIEGIRWTGCGVIDLGPASAPCAARAIQHLSAQGGIFVGNAHGAPHTVGLKFWAHGEPLSRGGLLDDIAAAFQTGCGEAAIDRPTRTFGPLRRFSSREVYLSDFRPAYHALRPLRFVLDCTLGPLVSYVEELIRDLACQIIFPERGIEERVGCVERTAGKMVGYARSQTADYNSPCSGPVRATHQGFGASVLHPPYRVECDLGEQVAAAQAHFGMQIADDGENCRVVDERGQSVTAERLLTLIAGRAAVPVLQGEELRQQTFRRMRESQAPIAVDTAGRLWYASHHAAMPDALQTLTHLLVLLSRKDLAFSAVLDQVEG